MKKQWSATVLLLTLALASCAQAPRATVPTRAVLTNEETPHDAADLSAGENPDLADLVSESDAGKNNWETNPENTDTEFAPGEILLPVDEGFKDESFQAFRAQLIEAVENKDKAFLLTIVHPDIQNGYSREYGIEDFQRRWQLDKADSRLWDELETVLKLGGAFHPSEPAGEGDADVFVAPYVSSSFPAEYTGFEYAAIAATDVALRAEPAVDSAAITALSYNIVKVDYSQSVINGEGRESQYVWLKVTTTEGEEGFVKGQYVRRPADYRAHFENEAGGWLLTFFAAGD